LRELWRNMIAPELNRRSVSTVSNASEALFGTLRDDVRRGERRFPLNGRSRPNSSERPVNTVSARYSDRTESGDASDPPPVRSSANIARV
jgi:hypothetical protein